MSNHSIIKSLGFTDARIITLASEAADRLSSFGLEREAVLVWLDQVADQPTRFLEDPALAQFAEALLSVSSVGEQSLCDCQATS